MKIQRRTEQEEDVVTDTRRIRPLRMDGLTMKEKYQDIKINIPKKKISPEEEAVPSTESAPVTVENKEEKTVQQNPSSKSTSPIK
jgi:hypothetical protein